jgi:hypothetical protein
MLVSPAVVSIPVVAVIPAVAIVPAVAGVLLTLVLDKVGYLTSHKLINNIT